jgi:hypothetical protein
LCGTPLLVWTDKSVHGSVNATNKTRYETVWNPLQTPVRVLGDALLVGPGWGLGQGRERWLAHLLALGLPGVIDADGLTLLAGMRGKERPALGGRWVLTPHPGEFSRITGVPREELRDRLFRRAVRQLHFATQRSDLDADETVERRVAFLTAYQSARYARRYRSWVDKAKAAEAEFAPGRSGLAEAVARYLFKLMAYKDEYEVARLYTDGSFRTALEAQFDGELRIELHLAPPLFARKDPGTGLPRKRRSERPPTPTPPLSQRLC